MLPAEVPVGDVHHPLCAAIRKRGLADDLGGTVVCVRLDGQNVGVDRQCVRVADGVGRVAGRDVDALRTEPENRRRARRRGVAEIHADRRADLFDGARRLHVQLHNEVAAGLKGPRQIGRHQWGDLSRRPAEEVAVGILGRARHQAVVSGERVGGVEPARRVGAIDADVGVVHDAGVARMELDAPHVAAFVNRDGQREDSECIGRVGAEHERLGQRDDEIGRAEQPTVGKAGRARGSGWIAFGCSCGGPGLEPVEFAVAQRPLVGEVPDGWVDFPWGHEPRAGHLHNLPGPLSHLAVGREAKRSRASGAMAGRTGLMDNRGNLYPRRRRLLRLSGVRARRLPAHGGEGQQAHHAPAPHHLSRSGRKHPTARVVAGTTGFPASSCVKAWSRSRVRGAGRSTPKSV